MPQIIKDHQLVENLWSVAEPLTEATTSINIPSNTLLSLNDWNAHQEAISEREDIGLLLETSADLNTVLGSIATIPIIAIRFNAFADGRGFSLGRLLRERYRFGGELRAIGAPIRDQLSYLTRCGFNAFELAEHYDPLEAIASLKDFSESYQTAVDQTEPLFRRVQRGTA